jgi:hypothetical protein
MLNKTILFLMILIKTQSYSQETVTNNTLSNDLSTNEWSFNCENYALTGIVKVQISKTTKGGILKLAIETTNPAFLIKGNVYVDLADQTVLVCTDKNNRTVNGNEITSYYYFSAIEMNKLRKTEIATIRFKIEGQETPFSSQTGNFTARNIMKKIVTAFDKSKNSYDTAKEISELYQ